jgi:hypothetical protein
LITDKYFATYGAVSGLNRIATRLRWAHALNEERTQLLRDVMALSRAQNGASRVIALLCARLKLTTTTPHRARPTEQRPWDIPGDGDEELPQ